MSKKSNAKVLSEDVLRDMMDPGSGVVTIREIVAKEKEEEEDKLEVETSSVEEQKDGRGQAIWTDTPSFQDQYSKYPTTCRLVGPTIDAFDIMDVTAKNDLNKLLADQQPVTAPHIMVASRDKAFHEGKWIVLLEYYRVEYKKLVTH